MTRRQRTAIVNQATEVRKSLNKLSKLLERAGELDVAVNVGWMEGTLSECLDTLGLTEDEYEEMFG